MSISLSRICCSVSVQAATGEKCHILLKKQYYSYTPDRNVKILLTNQNNQLGLRED